MSETASTLSPIQQAHERAFVATQINTQETDLTPIDNVSEMLELAESAKVARNILAQRYRDIHPEPQDMHPEHKERVIQHAHFLHEVGKISARDWRNIGLGNEGSVIPGDISIVARKLNALEPGYVASLTRPDWSEHFPEHIKLTQEDIGADQHIDALDEAGQALIKEQKWGNFKSQYPEDMQLLLEELRTSEQKLATAHENPNLFEAFTHEKDRRFDVVMSASAARSLTRTAQNIKAEAHKLRLSLPDGVSHKTVLDRANQLDKDAEIYELEAGRFVQNEAVLDEIARRARLDDRRDLKHGLLYTREMQDVVYGFVPQLLAGKPVLLVGETGGAKTAAAEEMARQVNKQLGRKDPNEYEFVSGYGQMNSYQLMGKDTIKDGSVEFTYGAITRALRDGKPLIIDEGNAMDPDILKRLNKVLQLKPGDTFQIQEDGGEKILVQKGFCVIMTANEKSTRYKGVNEMSSDFKNRFGANVARVSYPDIDILPGQVPKTLMRLAVAVLVDQYGNIPTDNKNIDAGQISKFVGACHRLQRLFAVPITDLPQGEVVDPAITRNAASGQTALKMETISPRLMTSILEDLRVGGRNGVTLKSILNRYVEGVTDISDRNLIESTLSSSGLL